MSALPMPLDRRRGERRSHEDRRAGRLVLDIPVGSAVAMRVRHGTGWLVLTISLDAKSVGEFPPEQSVDAQRLLVDLLRKSGQGARAAVDAPADVEVVR